MSSQTRSVVDDRGIVPSQSLFAAENVSVQPLFGQPAPSATIVVDAVVCVPMSIVARMRTLVHGARSEKKCASAQPAIGSRWTPRTLGGFVPLPSGVADQARICEIPPFARVRS